MKGPYTDLVTEEITSAQPRTKQELCLQHPQSFPRFKVAIPSGSIAIPTMMSTAAYINNQRSFILLRPKKKTKIEEKP